ncbi:protein phosphatase 1 regulatory subunit 12A isoform X2 [Hoplias malabaricus]|uniref:protein phosphatase 1 regulatory subunit 12A isoform X2 n=1 Tax=Hoplias malabaricus TaxID=27720 RepID=UPI0034632350
MAATDRSRSEAAKQRRQEQLARWRGSETDLTGAQLRSRADAAGSSSSGHGSGRRPKVRFAQGAVFMAACSAGDRDEVAELLRQGADINHANVDGLTALHQACIDENAEMVQFLVESGSDVNRGDNEGWTPLHAAASCGFIQIAKYLIEHGAQVGAVNSEGELPLDVATEDVMQRLLKGEIKKQGVDMDRARKEEERVMMQDATAVLSGSGSLAPHPNTQATALHVAAAKGYIEVLKVLLQCGLDVDSRDCDSWTPLHAAAHWGQEEACTLLVEYMCDMNAVNNVGQTALDVADENLVDTLEELQKKQNAMRTEKQKIQLSVIDTSLPFSVALGRTRRTSISRMSSREKITLHEREKHPPPALQTPTTEEDEEESNSQNRSTAPTKASSSSSSDEESESESDAESEKAKTRELINNLNNKRNIATPITTTTAAGSTTANQVKKSEPVRAAVSEAPGLWRTSLRKAGSSVTLGSSGVSDTATENLRCPETTTGMTRSASSPRLSSDTDTKEPRLARVQPTPSRRLFSIADTNTSTAPDNSGSWLSRSSSYTRRLNSQTSNEPAGQNSLPRSSSYGRKLDEPSVTSVTSQGTSGLGRLNNIVSQRLAQEQSEKKEPVSTTTTGEPETKQRRKSYLTPVRDEEAEAQRKARSRHARQSRRSTQGVTLTDLQEAEKTIKTEIKGKERKKEEEEKEGKQKKGEEGEVSWRSRIANLQKSDLLGLTHPPGAPRPADRRDTEDVAAEIERARERRRARARRREKLEGEDNEPSAEEESSGGLDPQMDRYLSSRSSNPTFNDCIMTGGSSIKDYKKLFEDLSRENSQLQTQLQDTQRTISMTRMELEKATQRQERFSDCTALLELEKKERMILERRAAELEEELKVLGDLRADNQRLKDENGALIRVISKLSK